MTKILTVIKTGLEKYCSIKTSHTGVNTFKKAQSGITGGHVQVPKYDKQITCMADLH